MGKFSADSGSYASTFIVRQFMFAMVRDFLDSCRAWVGLAISDSAGRRKPLVRQEQTLRIRKKGTIAGLLLGAISVVGACSKGW